jgi:hypothetical protein
MIQCDVTMTIIQSPSLVKRLLIGICWHARRMACGVCSPFLKRLLIGICWHSQTPGPTKPHQVEG